MKYQLSLPSTSRENPMSKAATSDLAERINREVDYCRLEYEMTYAEAVGVLVIVALELLSETGDSDA